MMAVSLLPLIPVSPTFDRIAPAPVTRMVLLLPGQLTAKPPFVAVNTLPAFTVRVPPLPPMFRLLVFISAPLVSTTLLPVPLIAKFAMLVTMAPLIVATLPVAAPLPTVKSLLPAFHAVLPRIVSVLFDEPLPTTLAAVVLATVWLLRTMVLPPMPGAPRFKPEIVAAKLRLVRYSVSPAS